MVVADFLKSLIVIWPRPAERVCLLSDAATEEEDVSGCPFMLVKKAYNHLQRP